MHLHPTHPLHKFILLLAISVTFIRSETGSPFALYRSQDHGRTFSRSDAGLPLTSRLNALAAAGQTFVAGTDSGIFLSTNSAKSWRSATIQIENNANVRITSLAPTDDRLYVGTSDGYLLTSSDGGLTWRRNPSFPKRSIRSLHFFDGSFYVGTDAHHVYQSADRGQTWTHLSAGLPQPAQIFALTSMNGRLFAGLYSQGLYTWNNADKKWNRLGASSHITPLALAVTSGTLIAGHNPGGIYSSDDLGQTWAHWSLSPNPSVSAVADSSSFSLFDSLTTQTSRGSVPALEAPIWEMAASTKIALAGAGSGIYYSTDRARTWARATAGLPSHSSGIAFLIQDDLILTAIHQNDCAGTPRNKMVR